MTTTIDGVAGWRELVGQHLGYSGWLEISQDRVQQFADATGDQQWIHVDVEQAKSGPFGGTIAHGYLTLALAPLLLSEVFSPEGLSMALNYGLNKLRFPSPVPVGSNLRAGAEVLSVEDIPGGVQVVLKATFEVEGAPKPACVAEIVFRYYE